jgi:hypothetical protein
MAADRQQQTINHSHEPTERQARSIALRVFERYEKQHAERISSQLIPVVDTTAEATDTPPCRGEDRPYGSATMKAEAQMTNGCRLVLLRQGLRATTWQEEASITSKRKRCQEYDE